MRTCALVGFLSGTAFLSIFHSSALLSFVISEESINKINEHALIYPMHQSGGLQSSNDITHPPFQPLNGTVDSASSGSIQHWWWNSQTVEHISRVYRPWNGTRHGWCILQTRPILKPIEVAKSGAVVGLIFVKNPKAASSTAAGITIQMAHNIAARKFNVTAGDKPLPCAHNWSHPFAFFRGHRLRKDPSLLWTIVRHPSKRAISGFFHFKVAREGIAPTSQNMIEHLENGKSTQLSYIMKTKWIWDFQKTKLNNKDAAGTVKKYVLDFYDFVAVVERMEESLVVMKILFDLEFRDVIVLSAKQSGGYDFGGLDNACVKIPKALTTPEVDKYLTHNFTKDNYDFILYAAANRSLDLTIDELGRRRVETEVREYRMLMKSVEQHCRSKAVFPCSAEGRWQRKASLTSCFAQDSGCGNKCVQQILTKHEQGLL
jgi:hypothetical protein